MRGALRVAAVEDEARFGAEIEEEIDDGEIGQKAVAVGKHLGVGQGLEMWIPVVPEFGADAFAQVDDFAFEAGGVEIVAVVDVEVGTEVEQAEDGVLQLGVEVDQPSLLAAIDGRKLVGIVGEIGTAVVGRDEGVPMEVAPSAVVGQADVAHRRFGVAALVFRPTFNGNREGLDAARGGDQAAVAVGLLDIVVAALFDQRIGAEEFGVILNGPEIGGGK